MQRKLLWLAVCTGYISSVIILSTTGSVTIFRENVAWISKEAETAAVFFVTSITVAQMNDVYHGAAPSPATLAGKIRVLIVPGHQPETGGTDFGGTYERDVVVDIANALAELLARNPHYEVVISRGKTAWNPVMQSYFDTHAADIGAFEQSQTLQMKSYLADGSILPAADQVYHNPAPPQAILQLYGINKWANDNKYDITLHLHLNDYAGRRKNRVGTYEGFAIYVPEQQYSNAEASKAVGESIAARLNAYHATSTLPKEDQGVVPDQQLIAIGSNNSADGAALLIEYGYIYEPQFQEPSILPVAVADYAYQTYLGLQDFFNDPVPSTRGSISFPYDWSKVSGKKNERGPGVYALQAALHSLGYYPPAGRSFSDCPVSGVAGDCTRSAVMEYQRAKGLETTGILGPQTRDALSRDTVQSETSPITLR